MEEQQEVNGFSSQDIKPRVLKSPPHWPSSIHVESAGSDMSGNGFGIDLDIDLNTEKTDIIQILGNIFKHFPLAEMMSTNFIP